MIEQLSQENIFLLQQGIDLVSQLNREQFCYEDAIMPSSIGKHLRHILDFYTAFFRGYSANVGAIDYDQRTREVKLEVEPEHFVQTAKHIQEQLAEIQIDKPLQIYSCEGGSEKQTCTNSFSFRELQFLLAHTVHHYALITVALRLQEFKVPEGFGIANSTKIYLKSIHTKEKP